jgi:hypothetical protein
VSLGSASSTALRISPLSVHFGFLLLSDLLADGSAKTGEFQPDSSLMQPAFAYPFCAAMSETRTFASERILQYALHLGPLALPRRSRRLPGSSFEYMGFYEARVILRQLATSFRRPIETNASLRLEFHPWTCLYARNMAYIQ